MLSVIFPDGHAKVFVITMGDDEAQVVLSASCPHNLGELIRAHAQAPGCTAQEIASWLQGRNWAVRVRQEHICLGN